MALTDAQTDPALAMLIKKQQADDDDHSITSVPPVMFLRVNPNQRAFLVAFAQRPSITWAAKVTGIVRQTHYDWLRTDEEYQRAFDDAKQMAADAVVLSAWRQGVEGIDEPIYQGGELVGHRRKWEPGMTKMLIQAWRPGEFADRTETTHRGSIGVRPEQDLSAYTEEELATLAEIQRRAKERQAASRGGQSALPESTPDTPENPSVS